jgi:hypothetical protein
MGVGRRRKWAWGSGLPILHWLRALVCRRAGWDLQTRLTYKREKLMEKERNIHDLRLALLCLVSLSHLLLAE